MIPDYAHCKGSSLLAYIKQPGGGTKLRSIRKMPNLNPSCLAGLLASHPPMANCRVMYPVELDIEIGHQS